MGASSSSASEWRQHIDEAILHKNAIASSSPSLVSLESISQGLRDACNDISAKERTINYQLGEASVSFKAEKTQLDSCKSCVSFVSFIAFYNIFLTCFNMDVVRGEYNTLSEDVQGLSVQLEGYSDQLEEVRSKLDQRDLNVNSTSPLGLLRKT